MYSGERKFYTLVACFFALCFVIVYLFLFIALWAYKEIVGATLLGLVVLAVLTHLALHARTKEHEQLIRQARIRHHEEIPLDRHGEPMYWPQGVQQNPHRHSQDNHHYEGYYQGYQEQQ